MSLLERVRCMFRHGAERPNLVQTAHDEVDKFRAESAELRDTLNRTGYLLGDAVFGRIDRRYLPNEGSPNEPRTLD